MRFMIQELETFYKYFLCSDIYKHWGFYVISAGHSKIPPHHKYPPVSHPDHHDFNFQKGRTLDSFTFVFIPQGQGIFDSEAVRSQTISAGNLFIVFPGVWHRYQPLAQTGWEEYWIEFGGNAAENFIKHSQLKPAESVLTIHQPARIMNIFLDILDISQNLPHGFEYLLSSEAFRLLTAVITERDIQSDQDKERTEAIRTARQILLRNLEQDIDLNELAEQVGMSYSLFRKSFKEITGFSPYQYRLNFRLHRAGQLLRTSKLQVSQIAQQLGFTSVYHFSELFKKKNTISPLEYRKNWKSGNSS
ncbi:MAG: helix-turn-helix transcriptional regulator [Sedimentisphaerales bacterium]|nr:helix-turn-helix transcriptional regulator [Sedimentisphaerales bacterium]